jgi:hypothetical protein
MSGRYPLSGVTPVDSTGAVYALATMTFYIVGTTTPADVYTTAALSVAHQNPLTLGADGRIPEIFMDQTRLKVVFKDSDGVTISGLSWDGIDKTKQRVKSASAPSPTYPGLEWHDTSTGNLKERNAANSAWIDRGAIDSIGNTASVTETLTGTETGKLVTPDGLAALWQRGSNITPSAGTVSLPSTGGGVFNIAAGDFAAISTAQGGRAVLFVFGGTSVITHNGTSMILPGGANLTTEAGDCAMFVNEAEANASGTNWRCVWFQRDSTTLAPPVNYAASQSEMEAASSALRWVTPVSAKWHPGVAKCWAYVTVSGGTPSLDASHNITSITDTNTGRLTITIATDFSSAAWSYACASEQPSAGTESIANIRTSTLAAGTVEVTCSALGGTDADPASYGFQGFGDHT